MAQEVSFVRVLKTREAGKTVLPRGLHGAARRALGLTIPGRMGAGRRGTGGQAEG